MYFRKLLGTEPENITSIDFENPFNAQYLKRFFLVASKYLTGWKFYADVQFEKGNNKGERRIEGNSIEDVLQKTKQFIDSL